jgi:glycosyltransferase involved in cell wall biosynthesis
VDLDFYELEGPKEEELAGRPVLIFVGNMDYRPNFEAVLRFAEAIFPRILERVPEALFLVVGANPTPQVRALDDGRSIRVTGRVPDTRTYLRAATVSVVPLSMARGIQTKVLEAMAMELPVVLTEQAALGIGAESGQDYEVVADEAALAEVVVDLLHNSSKRKELGSSARNFVRDSFAWADKLDRYEKILCESASTDRKLTAFN